MKNKSTPISLAYLRPWQQKYYERLLKMPHFNIVATIIEHFLKSIIDSGAFYIRVHPETIALILQSGTIKNVLETGRGVTEGGPITRRESAGRLFHADTSKMAPADFPKFGYLSHPDPQIDTFMSCDLSYQYGDAIIMLRKERLLDRTTITVGDSLNFDTSARLVPTLTCDIKATCVYGPIVASDRVDLRSMGNYFAFAEAIARKKITPDDFYRISATLGYEIPGFDFFELQYHGMVTLDDIESISVYPSMVDDFDNLSKLCEQKGVKLLALKPL